MPLSDASLPLQKAIVACVTADAGMVPLIGGRIYDAVPMNAVKPYVSFGAFQLLPEAGDCLEGGETVIQLDVWAKGPDTVEAKRVGAALITALDDAALALDGQRLVLLSVSDAQYLREPDNITSHGVVTIRALTEPAA
jgi:hypothetical protein